MVALAMRTAIHVFASFRPERTWALHRHGKEWTGSK
jgi:hypothetical protein